MGGLDARHMITHLGMDDRVAALVTLSTPHRGSPYADWCLRHLNRFKALQVLNMIGLDTGAAAELTTEACARFNDDTPDAPGVRYFSITAARPLLEVSPLLFQPLRIVARRRGSERRARLGQKRQVGPAPGDLAGRSLPHPQPPAADRVEKEDRRRKAVLRGAAGSAGERRGAAAKSRRERLSN